MEPPNLEFPGNSLVNIVKPKVDKVGVSKQLQKPGNIEKGRVENQKNENIQKSNRESMGIIPPVISKVNDENQSSSKGDLI